MSTLQNSKNWPEHQKQEYFLGRVRQVTVFIGAIGTLIGLFLIGNLVADMLEASPTARFILRFLLVVGGLAGIDLVAANSLSAASNPNNNRRSVWVLAGSALLLSLSLSLASNFFVSTEASGDTYLDDHNEVIERGLQQDSLNKAQAVQMLEEAEAQETQKIREAQAEKRQLIAAAVSSTNSSSYRRDYEAARHNPRHWFWTCQGGHGCPSKYRAYRNRIKAAEAEGDRLIAEARSHAESVQALAAPLLAYQVQNDSSLNRAGANYIGLEQLRINKGKTINWILFIVTVGAMILSVLITLELKSHRKQHGQHYDDDFIGPFIIFFDLLAFIGSVLADIAYNLLVRPWNYLQQGGWVLHYTAVGSRGVLVDSEPNNSNRTNNQQANNSKTNNPTDSSQQEGPKPTTPNQQAKPTAENQQLPAPTKPNNCNGPRCTNKRRAVDVDDKFIELYRLQWKRQFTSKTEAARERNRIEAAEKEQVLRDLGATISKDQENILVHVVMPKV